MEQSWRKEDKQMKLKCKMCERNVYLGKFIKTEYKRENQVFELEICQVCDYALRKIMKID